MFPEFTKNGRPTFRKYYLFLNPLEINGNDTF